MLVELAAANAAFAVIKEAVQHSGDIMAAGSKVFEYFDHKSAIQKKYEAKAKSAKTNDIEEFFALEQLKKQETELREMMQWQGRAGMWQDWLNFQRDAKHKRIAAEQAEIRRAEERRARAWEVAGWTLIGTILSVLIAFGLWIADFIRTHR